MRALAMCLLPALLGFAVGRWTFATDHSPKANAAHDTHATIPVADAPPIPGADLTHAAASTASAPKDLAEAMADSDPLTVAPRVMAWLDQATREDFQEALKTPSILLPKDFYRFDPQFRQTVCDAIVERWLVLDPEGALTDMVGFREKAGSDGRGVSVELLRAAARAEPERMLAEVPLLGADGGPDVFVASAVESLATRDVNKARAILGQFESREIVDTLRRAIFAGAAQTDPLQALALAREWDLKYAIDPVLKAARKIGTGMLRQVIAATSEMDQGSATLPLLILQNPNLADDVTGFKDRSEHSELSEPTTEMLHAADRLRPEERSTLLRRCNQLPPGMGGAVAAALVSAWARNEPEAAVAWALAHGDPGNRTAPMNAAATAATTRWFVSEPEKVLGWWRNLPESSLRDEIGTTLSSYAVDLGKIDEAVELFRPQAGEAPPDFNGYTIRTGSGSTDDEVGIIAQELAVLDPGSAVRFIVTQPPNVATSGMFSLTVPKWFQQDPVAVGQFVESLPPSPQRDRVLRLFVGAAANIDPQTAALWVERIEKPELRQFSALDVYSSMRRSNEDAARQWLESLNGVDPEWAARYLRLNP